jgi:hypothetical protein
MVGIKERREGCQQSKRSRAPPIMSWTKNSLAPPPRSPCHLATLLDGFRVIYRQIGRAKESSSISGSLPATRQGNASHRLESMVRQNHVRVRLHQFDARAFHTPRVYRCHGLRIDEQGVMVSLSRSKAIDRSGEIPTTPGLRRYRKPCQGNRNNYYDLTCRPRTAHVRVRTTSSFCGYHVMAMLLGD